MTKSELITRVALSSIISLSLGEKIKVFNTVKNSENLKKLTLDELCSIIGRTSKIQNWNGNSLIAQAEKSIQIMDEKNISCFFFDQNEYPAMLRTIKDSPFGIYIRGNPAILNKPCISIVGTRDICEECALQAENFAYSCAKDGRTVISGLANGIDFFAHKGALKEDFEGATAAVLPCGIETIVPGGNKRLASKILSSGGCIISEYIPGTPAEPWRFVQRNRLIAALSPVTIIIQAPQGSGALITADYCLDYNREVVIHSVALCKEALEKNKKHQAKKNGNSIQKLIAEGAPVVKDYEDFKKFLNDAPGSHSVSQLELF